MTTTSPTAFPPSAIAIIGMAGRFPGARSVSEFWRKLSADEEGMETLSEDDLRANGVSESTLSSPHYVRRAPVMDGIEEFDADFFGFNPRTAAKMDPQHRLFLQTAWHALEDGGYDPADIEVNVGVFGTSSMSGYLLHNLMSNIDPNKVIGEGPTIEMVSLSLENDKDHLATRVAHQFNLRGPALAVQTACSSSLLAVHLACQSILNGECDMALAGGSSIRIPNRVGYWYEPGSMASPTGYCRPFDVRADGTIFGSGVGVVLLKPLEDALADGDRIHAVIRGSAINNDGATKMNYAAPNATGQAEVIAEAHALAEVDASSIGYVETHGTATPLGDPIEIEGLRQAFELAEQERSAPCVLGSVKSNIGHLETAAGIAALIKTVLCLENKALPGTLHYTQPNPELHLERGPFEVRGQHSEWSSTGPRRAGVSAFGMGGTNVHMVLEEAPVTTPVPASSGSALITLSARSRDSVTLGRTELADELDVRPDLDIADVAHTLAHRRAERYRLAAVVADSADAVRVLRADEHDNVFIGEAPAVTDSGDRVAFVFPGQGAQHIGMAAGLFESQPVFAEHFTAAAELFSAELDFDLRAEILTGSARSLERTDRTQPALFAVEYALAELARSRGIVPAALAGHSIGEYAAATFAGVFDLPTAVKAVAMRARLMNAAPRGVMVAVPRAVADIAGFLGGDVDVSTINDPGSCVVGGTQEAIAEFTARLSAEGIVARRVRTSHAFHSRLMDGVVAEFTAFLSRLTLREPHIPILSNVTGTWMSAAEATSAATWARQIRATVRFADEITTLLDHPARVLVEVGPGGTLTSAAARHPKWSENHRAVRLMRHPAQNRDDEATFLLAIGQLWAAGVDVPVTDSAVTNSAGTDSAAPRRRVTLPGYPFARQKHWIEHNSSARFVSAGATDGAQTGEPTRATSTPASGRATMEATLEHIWAQCLGVTSIDRNANFFEIGGDSLIAISIAMSASNEGLELTPQDLYENQTIAALAKKLTARYESGGLGRKVAADPQHLPVPPNLMGFLSTGVADAARWRIPLLLRLHGDIPADTVRTVLTAVINHHDALRTRFVERVDGYEQHIGAPAESVDLVTAEITTGLEAGESAQRTAILDVLNGRVAAAGDAIEPIVAVLVSTPDGPSYLALSVHGVVADHDSRGILLTDLFTAFGQVLAGEDISLQPVAATWAQWSQLSAELVGHPSVLETREYWLGNLGRATLRLIERTPGLTTVTRPATTDLRRFSTSLTEPQTTELDDARRRLTFSLDQFLVAALTRAVAGTIGEGVLDVDFVGAGRSVLRPELDPRRTVGSFESIHPVALRCDKGVGRTAADRLDEVRSALSAVPHEGVGYGVLRHLYAPTAVRLAAADSPDILFSFTGTIPDLSAATDAPVQLDADAALAIGEAVPGFGHAIEVRCYRAGGVLHLDWWHDSRRIDAQQVGSLAGAVVNALVDLSREAIIEDEAEATSDELEFIDLSSNFDMGAASARQ
ncbi:MAG: beta-ketoacyl synthase N-terminal-like domain-containing protein [Gordonia sp. (in: high G+C Gram-positive bacteria)]